MHTDKGYAFHNGWQAYFHGNDRHSNPYKETINEYPADWFDWVDGFEAAMDFNEGEKDAFVQS